MGPGLRRRGRGKKKKAPTSFFLFSPLLLDFSFPNLNVIFCLFLRAYLCFQLLSLTDNLLCVWLPDFPWFLQTCSFLFRNMIIHLMKRKYLPNLLLYITSCHHNTEFISHTINPGKYQLESNFSALLHVSIWICNNRKSNSHPPTTSFSLWTIFFLKKKSVITILSFTLYYKF